MLQRGRYDPDSAARMLNEAARHARLMPKTWQAVKHRIPLTAPDGGRIGFVLPGKGVVLNDDLRAYGITRGVLPHVVERSLFDRAVHLTGGRERLAVMAAAAITALALKWNGLPELPLIPALAGAITSYDDIISGRAGGKARDITFVKSSITTVANTWFSLFAAGGQPAAMTFTGISGGAVMVRSNAGALSLYLSDPTGGDKTYLLTFGFYSSSAINFAYLTDVLVSASGISTTTTSPQTINTVALNRNTGAIGVLMILEGATATAGGTASNITITYTNSADTGSRSSGALALTTTAIVGRLQPQVVPGPFVPMQSGDLGVKSVETITLSASMTGTGTLVLHLHDPITIVPGIASNSYIERDSTAQIDGLAEILQTSGAVLGCLGLLVSANTTSSGALGGFIRTVSG